MPSLNHVRIIPAKIVCDDDGDFWTMDTAGSSNRCRATNPTMTNSATADSTTRHRRRSRPGCIGGTSCIGIDPAVAHLTSSLDVCSFSNAAAPLSRCCCDAAAMLLLSPPRESSRTRTTGQSTGSICRSTPSVCRWYGTRFSNTPPLTAIVRRGTAIVVVHLTAAVAIQQRRWLAAAFSL